MGHEREDYKIAIARHLAEDALRRQTVRNALALAQALGRILILPAARCYCDKIWNNLNGCRAPGSETFRLPYACPMDHIYDLPAWFRHDLHFREPGFLSDPRVPAEVKRSVGKVHVVQRANKKSGMGAPQTPVSRAEAAAAAAAKESNAASSSVEGGGGEQQNHVDAEGVIHMHSGFDANQAVAWLKPFESKRVIEIDWLGAQGSFCGFGSEQENVAFDRKTGTYVCFSTCSTHTCLVC